MSASKKETDTGRAGISEAWRWPGNNCGSALNKPFCHLHYIQQNLPCKSLSRDKVITVVKQVHMGSFTDVAEIKMTVRIYH